MTPDTRVRRKTSRPGPLAIAAAALAIATPTAGRADVPPPPSSLVQAAPPEPREDMSEVRRAEIGSILVVATRDPAGENVSGSYDKDTYGLMGGVAAGHDAGRVRKEVGPVPVDFRIPGTTIPGMVIGGLFGSVQREVQELRDALTEELVDARSTPLTDDGLALDVFSWLRRMPDLDSKILAPTAPLPEATDAMLYVKFGGVAIDVQGRDAVITTTATASLRSLGNNRQIYHTIVHYQDRDSLKRWTENDNRLWHTYVNYARHYLGRELAARIWNRIDLPHALAPAETASLQRDRKNPLNSISRSRQPELAWTLEIGDPSGSAWADKGGRLDESATWYDVEIYDLHRLVVFEENVPEPRYTVPLELDCGEYRWSVRPSWRVDGTVRYGQWMHFPPPEKPAKEDDDEAAAPLPPNGVSGRSASRAPAYTQDFPLLTVACRRS